MFLFVSDSARESCWFWRRTPCKSLDGLCLVVPGRRNLVVDPLPVVVRRLSGSLVAPPMFELRCVLWGGSPLVPNRQYLAVRYRPAGAPELFVLLVSLPTLERSWFFLRVGALLAVLLVGFLHGKLTWRLSGPCLVLA